MKIKKMLIAVGMTSVLIASPVVMAADIDVGKAASTSCVGCHGADGKSPIMPTYPKIAGQSEQYLINALKDYRAGKRTSASAMMMKGMATTIPEDKIDDIAAYFASLTP